MQAQALLNTFLLRAVGCLSLKLNLQLMHEFRQLARPAHERVGELLEVLQLLDSSCEPNDWGVGGLAVSQVLNFCMLLVG